MPTQDPRIDAYIAKAPSFAQPILKEIRARVHEAFPNVEEAIKWNAPFFLKEGRLLASMAAFKQHAKFGLWGLKGPDRPEFVDLTSIDALPPKVDFVKRVQSAVAGIGESARTAARKVRTATRSSPVEMARALVGKSTANSSSASARATGSASSKAAKPRSAKPSPGSGPKKAASMTTAATAAPKKAAASVRKAASKKAAASVRKGDAKKTATSARTTAPKKAAASARKAAPGKAAASAPKSAPPKAAAAARTAASKKAARK